MNQSQNQNGVNNQGNVPQNNQVPPQGQYPQSGMPYYPNSGMNNYPRSGMNNYPGQPQMPYGVSGMPMYGQPYMQQMPQKKKMSTAKFAAIFVSIVLVAIIGAIVLLLVLNKDGNSSASVEVDDVIAENEVEQISENDEVDGLPKIESFKEFAVSNSKINIDGSMYIFPDGIYNMDNVNYVAISQLADLFGVEYETDTQSKTAVVKVNADTYTLTHDLVEGDKQDSTGKITKVPLTRPPIMFTNGEMYVSIKGLAEVFGFKSVDWDSDNGCIKIITKTLKIPSK